MATTRLDRLVSLLDTGSTAAIKSTAAKQLGQIANQRVRGGQIVAAAEAVVKKEPKTEDVDPQAPVDGRVGGEADHHSGAERLYHGTRGQWDEALHLCSRVVPFLHSRSWETREAAALAIESICRGAGVWKCDESLSSGEAGPSEAPASDSVKKETSADTDGDDLPPQALSQDDLLTFEDFQLERILANGNKLLASTGKEYDIFASGGSLTEHMAQAKADLARMGLGGMGGVEMDLGLDVEAELKQAEQSNAASRVSSPKLPPPRFAPPPPGTSIRRFGSPDEISGNKAHSPSPLGSPKDSPKGEVAVLSPPADAEPDLSKLSARERNQLKRKRKLENKGGSRSGPSHDEKTRIVESTTAQGGNEALSAATGLRVKTPSWVQSTPVTSRSGASGGSDYFEAGSKSNNSGTSSPAANSINGEKGANNAVGKQHVSLVAPSGEWPFSHLSALILLDLFSAKWEIRHGACLALRALFTVQGRGGGTSLLAANSEDNSKRKERWSEDAAVKLLCLMCLDRLSDFVFDQVVAPVREVAAQALSALLPHMSDRSKEQLRLNLLAMTRQSGGDGAAATDGSGAPVMKRRGDAGYAWEVRHAGLSGLRWLVERTTLQTKPEPKTTDGTNGIDVDPRHAAVAEVVTTAIVCLRDSDDDIRAMASAVLLPLAPRTLVADHADMLPHLMDTIWLCLSDLKDDLNSSTGSVMDLLATLLHDAGVSVVVEASRKSASELVPLIYPFFRHTIQSVRLSVLKTVQAFLEDTASRSAIRDWIDERLFRLLFQNLIVEEKLPIRAATEKTWHVALSATTTQPGWLESLLAPHLAAFGRILMTPLGTPFEYRLFYSVAAAGSSDESRYNVDKSILAQDLSLVGVDTVIRGRLGATHALGVALARMGKAPGLNLTDYLESPSALQRCLTAYVVQEWSAAAEGDGQSQPVELYPELAGVSSKLLSMIETPPPPTWSEMSVQLSRIQLECQALLRAFQQEGKVAKGKIPTLPTKVDPLGKEADAFTCEMAETSVTRLFDDLVAEIGPKTRKQALPILQDRQRKIIASIGFYREAKDKQDTQVLAAVSAAVIALKTLPAKLNPLIRSIMNSVKFEENAELQQRSAKAVASLIEHCRSPGAKADPSPKIIRNLAAFVCQDTTQTSVFASVTNIKSGIMSLNSEKSSSAAGKWEEESEQVRQGKLIRRGAEMVLQEMATMFGADLFSIAPALWESMTTHLLAVYGDESADVDAGLDADQAGSERGQGILDCCTLIETVSSRLTEDHRDKLEGLFSPLSAALRSRFAAIRSAAAKCLSGFAECLTLPTMIHIVRNILPLLDDPTNVTHRQGSIELLGYLVNRLDVQLLPYVIVLVVPVLGRMNDSDSAVRLSATSTFASLVKMVPLEAGLPDPPGFPADLLRRREEERQFMAQLLDGSKVEAYKLPVPINAELRKYQREGVSWMHFLARFKLHGVLCDDMGLGKTLQTICILSAKHFERDERFKATKAADSAPLPSLVVCPTTLTGHWCHEISQYATNLRPLLYTGSPTDRAYLQGEFNRHDVVVMSYEVLRNDIADLSKRSWNYCILDEGHMIKSAKTKTTKAVKAIQSNHRLILTGTPIQNNVLELWSLFDFLMPGFLGTERAFHERFGKPILSTREGKASPKEQEAAALALESLHRQVLPFLLRRLKDDVLDDLPPKIIQDIECEMGIIQKKLYDEHSRSQSSDAGSSDIVTQALEGSSEDGAPSEGGNKQHVFQTLQYLRKLVNHPALVYDPTKPKHKSVVDAHLSKSGTTLRDISHAPKLQSLMQLLQSCGVGVDESANGSGGEAAGVMTSVSSQHRVLIFCQMKQMLDIIEHDLFKVHMPSVTYMRLDGSVAADKRHGIVQVFNSDPSIDVLLLTTQVGGLGLTLTGADTVIFVEHDWNPMKDLQAMDRAHRLGQKKVVNVYRLITRDTLEARIMGLQQFKLNVANTVISQQNKGMDSMSTEQVLDLFQASASGKDASAAGAGSGKSSLEAAIAAANGSGAATGGSSKISQKALLAHMDAMGDTGNDYSKISEWRPE
ncbi:unnamed protein product [Jaminaea pallidilutea]